MTTQKAIFSYEEVIDLHTESNRVSVIGIHTPTGDTPRRLCPGFFEQFKKYKYLGCSVTLVPAATLPADPLSVSYEAGEPTIDPRDMLNPILFHGCHGNDMGNILNRLYSSGLADSTDFSQVLHSDSVDLADMWNIESENDDVPSLQILESLYYRALTDKTWKKANVQRGFRKTGLRPRIYSLATNMQLMGQTSLGTQRAPGIIEGSLDLSTPLDPEFDLEDPVVNPVRYFTPRTVPLGWLDTRQVVPYVAEGEISNVDVNDLPETIEGLVKGKTVWNELPEIYMGMILLPPAYKTEMYFRMVINHHFAFAGFRGISLSNDMIEMPPNYEDWNEAISSHEGGSVDPPSPGPEPDPDPVPVVSLSNQTMTVPWTSTKLYQTVTVTTGSDAVQYNAYDMQSGASGSNLNPNKDSVIGVDADMHLYAIKYSGGNVSLALAYAGTGSSAGWYQVSTSTGQLVGGGMIYLTGTPFAEYSNGSFVSPLTALNPEYYTPLS